MAKRSGLGQIFFVGGYDLSGDVGAINSFNSPVATHNVTGLNKSSIERVRGLASGDIDFMAFFNDAAGQAHAALSTLPTTDRVVLWGMGETQGDSAAFMLAKQINYDPSRDAGGNLTIGIQAQTTGAVPIEFGEMFSAGVDTQASSGQTASKDDAAGTSNGLAAVLQVVDIDSGTPTVTIEDSANDSTWATLVAFTAVADGSEPTAERVTVSGNVDRYLRLNISGTFTNLDYAVAYRRGESVDKDGY